MLITGSRDWTNRTFVQETIAAVATKPEEWVLVHGGAVGADEMAANFARSLGMRVEEHRADWDRYGKRAGYVRNKKMVDAGAEICLAFIKNESRGATMCANLASEAGITTWRFTP